MKINHRGSLIWNAKTGSFFVIGYTEANKCRVLNASTKKAEGWFDYDAFKDPNWHLIKTEEEMHELYLKSEALKHEEQ